MRRSRLLSGTENGEWVVAFRVSGLGGLRVPLTPCVSILWLTCLWYRYPVILDAYIQSASLGFVGTARSTFSTLARLRVKDWHNGIVKMVKWGRPGADNN